MCFLFLRLSPSLPLRLQLTAAGARPSVRGQSLPQASVRGQGSPPMGIKPIHCSTSSLLSHGWNLGSPVRLCKHSWSRVLFSRCQMMSLRWGRVAIGGGLSRRRGWETPKKLIQKQGKEEVTAVVALELKNWRSRLFAGWNNPFTGPFLPS